MGKSMLKLELVEASQVMQEDEILARREAELTDAVVKARRRVRDLERFADEQVQERQRVESRNSQTFSQSGGNNNFVAFTISSGHDHSDSSLGGEQHDCLNRISQRCTRERCTIM